MHINAVGSYTREAREVPAETVRRALVVVDSREAAWQEAGDLIQPLEAGLIDRDHIHAELGELVLGASPAAPTRANHAFQIGRPGGAGRRRRAGMRSRTPAV